MAAEELILASASPRRAELLRQLGAAFRCLAAAIDETPAPGEPPGDYVQRMAREKAVAVAARAGRDSTVLAADTIVVLDQQILGKPRDRMDAFSILARLSGRTHAVMTALCLLGGGDVRELVVATEVDFETLDAAVCEAYLATGEPWDKAGAYAIQGVGGALVRSIRGSYSNVVGLPLLQTRLLLAEAGIATALDPSPGGRV